MDSRDINLTKNRYRRLVHWAWERTGSPFLFRKLVRWAYEG